MVKIDTTKGRIVFMLAYGLCACSCYCMFKWNNAAAIIVLGYVIVAQTGVNAYFQHPSDDHYKRFIVTFLALGYCIILYLSLQLWNDNVTHEIASGIALFILAIVKEYYTVDESGAVLPTPPTVAAIVPPIVDTSKPLPVTLAPAQPAASSATLPPQPAAPVIAPAPATEAVGKLP
jgi:hypothetical protein